MKRQKSYGRTAELEEALNELYLTPGGCSLGTLADAGEKYREMKVEDFTLQCDDDGNKFLIFAEGPTKTIQGRLSVKTRLVNPKMFAQGMRNGAP